MDNQVETIYEETVGFGTANVTAERNWVCANPICRMDGRKAADACVSLKRISTMKTAHVWRCSSRTLCIKQIPAESMVSITIRNAISAQIDGAAKARAEAYTANP